MSADSDEVVAAGLRLLWELDAFLAEVGASRIDDIPVSDRESLLDAFSAASAALASAHPRRKTQQRG